MQEWAGWGRNLVPSRPRFSSCGHPEQECSERKLVQGRGKNVSSISGSWYRNTQWSAHNPRTEPDKTERVNEWQWERKRERVRDASKRDRKRERETERGERQQQESKQREGDTEGGTTCQTMRRKVQPSLMLLCSCSCWLLPERFFFTKADSSPTQMFFGPDEKTPLLPGGEPQVAFWWMSHTPS